MQEMWVWSLGQENLLEEERTTHSGILVWEIPRTEEPGRLKSMGLPDSWTRLNNNLEIAQTPQVKGLVPQDCPHFRYGSQEVGPQVTHCFWLHHKLVPMTSSPLDSVICKNSSQNSVDQLLTFTSLLHNKEFDINEQPDQDIHRASSGRLPRAGASVPLNWGALLSKYVDVTNLEVLWTLCYWEFMELPHVDMINYELHFQLLSPLWRKGVCLEIPRDSGVLCWQLGSKTKF